MSISNLVLPSALSIVRHKNGVLDFTDGKKFWQAEELAKMDEEKWIEKNWGEGKNPAPERQWLCRQAIMTHGPMLEVAIGPGGGNLSPILNIAPSKEIVANDIESRILDRWKTFLQSEQTGANVSFAAFDVCNNPYKDNLFGAVSSSGGLSTILGDHGQALKECARVLMTEGILISLEWVISVESLASMPAGLKASLVYHPWLFNEWEPLFSSANLDVVSAKKIDRRLLDPSSNALAFDAASYGAILEMDLVAILAIKRES
ncbi:MAG: methyltransferase domain-containing protein [bacterium]|nr:methyltransferase domain-containing protein [bacterium]